MSSITILHIEDDVDLASVVRLAFERFGFQGEFLHASTVAQGLERIRSRKEHNQPLDLIIADMNLPDGRGLEIVRQVKSYPAWASIPVLLLSSDTKSSVVAEAYALGVNCYVPKNNHSLLKTLESVYHFWLNQTILPRAGKSEPLREYLGRTVSYKARVAELYSWLAHNFSSNPDRSGFWLSLALYQSNHANLIAFVSQSLSKAIVPLATIDCLQRYADAKEPGIQTVLNLAAANPHPSQDQALQWAMTIENEFDPVILAMGISSFFPNEPVASHAFQESTTHYLQQLSNRALLESNDPKVRTQADQLLSHAATLGKLVDSRGNGQCAV